MSKVNASTRLLVLSGYRRLMRTRSVVFQDHDEALRASRIKIREEIAKNINETEPLKLEKLIKGLNEVEEMLRNNVVQSKRNERGNFEVKMRPENLNSMQSEPNVTLKEASLAEKLGKCSTTNKTL
mmetsp:Transcript_11857/g.17680  ORF Transcript_11857/g.17680 Transcript_11857/m.17680 type:complete len:126 (+) Transcript_11857:81-458(+)